MAVDLDVPFYANTPDDTHCYQSALRMIIKYYQPGKDYSWDDLDKITGKFPKGSTWGALGHIWLVEQGFDVEYWSLLKWNEFVEKGYDYLLQEFGGQVADWQAQNGDIALEQTRAQQALSKVPTFQKEPHIKNITDFLDRGYLLKCTVNSSMLNDKSGYTGHVVVVKGYTYTSLILHDPGPPYLKDREVGFETFESAWAYPNNSAKELTAIKLA